MVPHQEHSWGFVAQSSLGWFAHCCWMNLQPAKWQCSLQPEDSHLTLWTCVRLNIVQEHFAPAESCSVVRRCNPTRHQKNCLSRLLIEEHTWDNLVESQEPFVVYVPRILRLSIGTNSFSLFNHPKTRLVFRTQGSMTNESNTPFLIINCCFALIEFYYNDDAQFTSCCVDCWFGLLLLPGTGFTNHSSVSRCGSPHWLQSSHSSSFASTRGEISNQSSTCAGSGSSRAKSSSHSWAIGDSATFGLANLHIL